MLVAAAVVYQFTLKVLEVPSIPSGRAAGHVPGSTSIAVLPLKNLSHDPEQAYFVNGIHDALISDLSHISGFRVTSKTTARAYERVDKSVADICSDLAISKLIEGSALRVDDDVQVDVRLIDRRDRRHQA